MLKAATFGVLAFSFSGVLAFPGAHSSHGHGPDVIYRDVAVIGGGSAGTYAAVRLNDINVSVVVIEKDVVLGGHADTYVDKTTGTKLNMGVADFHKISVVLSYAARLGVPMSSPGAYDYSTLYYDFDTGKTVPSFVPPTDAEVGAAFATYANILATNYSYLQAGYFLPDPVPAELLEPFGDFVNKYGIGAIMQLINQIVQNDGDIWTMPTVQLLKAVDLSLVQSALQGFLVVASGNTQDLYTSAASVLGQDVLYSSQAIKMDRHGRDGVTLTVQTANGIQAIPAKRLVVAIPPTLDVLSAFDLTDKERSTFSKFQSRGYYASVVQHSGIDPTEFYTNIGTNTPFHLQNLPGIFTIQPTGLEHQYAIYAGTLSPVSNASAQDVIVSQIETLQNAGVFPADTPEFLYFSNHCPFRFGVLRGFVRIARDE
ncbi:hypothetical protein BAUCODRAFT_23436 [Baudoinia panamericana UAMH 10762]|uniref:Amine oxidase domain-containing protein n=1 Tax=Baudoinia panamericana (strain UAMH 10762) TaxID=717646 RepID=M2MK29_BAUPA|nr:uncharacterized protein BAUCODRAFT_23436 [Baudoinia panamericana UAMH 10762]EMC97041.1 hypothetical protein BAUCODRAFT_23436 [Baudoinia panamericana UAMH 10762]